MNRIMVLAAFAVGLFSATAFAGIDAELAGGPEALRARLAKDVKSISVPSRALPGTVLAAGSGAVPLAFGSVKGVEASVAAASASGAASGASAFPAS